MDINLRILSYLIISVIGFGSCQLETKTGGKSDLYQLIDDSLTLQEKYEEMNRIMEKAMLEGDYETLLKFFSEDVIVMADFHPPIRGKKELRKRYAEEKKYGIKLHSFTGTPEKVWECGSEVFEMGGFGLAVSSKEHKRPKAYYGSYFQIAEVDADSLYKIKFFIWNLDFNPFDN